MTVWATTRFSRKVLLHRPRIFLTIWRITAIIWVVPHS